MLTEEERAEERRARVQRLNEAAGQALRSLPLAGTTIHCPKCRFDHLTYRYATRYYWPRHGGFHRSKPTWPGSLLPELYVIVRTCPQCSAETYERPADTIEDYS
jgi:hypothetical protein